MSNTPIISKPAGALIVFAAFVVSIAGLRAISPILTPFLLAIFLSIVFSPLYFGLQRLRMPPALALVFLFLFLLAIMFLVVSLLDQTAITLREKLPYYQEVLQQRTDTLMQWLQMRGVETQSMDIQRVFDWQQIFTFLGSSLSTLTGLLGTSFLVLLFTVFILVEANALPAKLALFKEFGGGFWETLQRVLNEIRRYMAFKTAMSLLTGALVWVLLVIMEIDFPAMLAFTAFALNFIPTIGSFMAAVPAVILALIQHDIGTALILAAGYVVVNMGVSNIIEPKVMGRGLGLSPLVIILSMVFWGWVLGIIGMLLSVPLTMTAKIAMEGFEETRWLAALLSGGTLSKQARASSKGA